MEFLYFSQGSDVVVKKKNQKQNNATAKNNAG